MSMYLTTSRRYRQRERHTMRENEKGRKGKKMDVWIEKRKKEREGEKVRDVHNVDLGKNKHINK